MNKVFIINKSGHNHTDALRYGSLEFLTEGHIDRFDTNNMYRVMSEAINDSSPNDYILLTSLTSLCSMACAMFAFRHGILNLLIWKDGRYIERRQDISSLLDQE